MHRTSLALLVPLSLLLPSLMLPLLLSACSSHEEEASPKDDKGLQGKYEILSSHPLDFLEDDELEMDTRRGALRVFPVDAKGPRIEAKIQVFAPSDVEAQAIAENLEIRTRKRGHAHHPEINKGSRISWSPSHVMVVSYTAYVPAMTSVRMSNTNGIHEVHGRFRGIYITSKYGDICIKDATGNMRLKTLHGKVTLQNTTGEELEIDTMSSRVDLTQVEARNLTVRTRDGAIRMEGVQATNILLSSSYGDIEIFGLRGNLIAHNKNGSIEVVGLTKGHHEISTVHGEVRIQGASGELEVHTTSAEIRVTDFRGEADLESLDGDIRAAGLFSQLRCTTKSGRIRARAEAGSKAARPWRFSSRFGEISLGMRQVFPCILALSTDSGSFENKLPLSKVLSKDSTSLRGQIGEGGQEVYLSSSSGRIETYPLAAKGTR